MFESLPELTEELSGVLCYHFEANDHRTITSLQGRFQELTGYSYDDFRNNTGGFRALIHPGDRGSRRSGPVRR